MNVERFLYQVKHSLPQHENVKVWIDDSVVKVGYGDTGSFEIRYPGGVCYNAATEKTEELERLVDEADKTFRTVKEYIELMENAPPLTARDFNMPYKKLAEFNGIVLGGIEHLSNKSFEFTTWSYDKDSLYHGHYYKDYEQAKEDFAVRSGLVHKELIFTPKEHIEIYRCIVDTLDGEYELTDNQTQILENLRDRIKDEVPDFDRMLSESQEETIQEFEQTM